MRSGGSGPVHAAERVPDHRPPVRRHRLCGREGLGVHDGQGVCARRDPGVCIHGQRGSAGREQAGRTRLRRRHGAGKRPPADRFVRVELVAGNLGFEHNDFFQEQAVKDAKSGQVEFRVEKQGIIHSGIGKLSFSDDALKANFKALTQAIVRAKPSGSKGKYVRKISLTSSMGPGLKVDLSEVEGA